MSNDVTFHPMTPAAIRNVDRYAIEQLGIPGLLLMEHAATNICDWLLQNTSESERSRIVLLCGPGNNGGDALAVARLLYMQGVPSTCLLAAERARYRGDAGTNLQMAMQLGLDIVDAREIDRCWLALESGTLLLDGLLGTGSSGNPRDVMGSWIETANAGSGRRIAIDLPSGLDATRGVCGVPTFVAETTLTLLAPKTGFEAAEARGVVGEVVVLGIGLSEHVVRAAGKNPPSSG